MLVMNMPNRRMLWVQWQHRPLLMVVLHWMKTKILLRSLVDHWWMVMMISRFQQSSWTYYQFRMDVSFEYDVQ